MQVIKGFCTRKRQANNEPGQTAAFGELSTYVRTFAKDIGIYATVDYPEIEFNLFSNKRNGQAQNILNTEYLNAILQITEWIYSKSTTIDSGINKNDYLVNANNVFHGIVENLNIGAIKSAEGRTMPEWFKFKLSSIADNEVTVWLSAAAMERDYDEYEITVVSPLINVDTLFRPIAEIRSALNLTPITDQMDKIQAARNKMPETVLKAESIQYINPVDNNITIDTTWYVMIYGPAGNNSEAIKYAIIDYILERSNESEAAWKQILPYLFKITRMFILPRWDKFAIPNRQLNVGIYSPIASAVESLTYARSHLSHMASTFIEENTEITHHKYRSIILICCGGDDNAQNKFKLSDYVPDYIGESSTSQDFNRMSETTKQWSVALEEMLIIAESFNSQSHLPIHTRVLTINNTKYLARKLGRVEYLLAIKEEG